MIGTSVFPGMITESGDLIIVAVQRGGADIAANEATLEAGDTILLLGTWKALDLHLDDPDVLVVNSPELVRRQAIPLAAGANAPPACLRRKANLKLARRYLPARRGQNRVPREPVRLTIEAIAPFPQLAIATDRVMA